MPFDEYQRKEHTKKRLLAEKLEAERVARMRTRQQRDWQWERETAEEEKRRVAAAKARLAALRPPCSRCSGIAIVREEGKYYCSACFGKI